MRSLEPIDSVGRNIVSSFKSCVTSFPGRDYASYSVQFELDERLRNQDTSQIVQGRSDLVNQSLDSNSSSPILTAWWRRKS